MATRRRAGQSALSSAAPAQHPAHLSPVALLQTFAKNLILSRWHMAQRERQETPPHSRLDPAPGQVTMATLSNLLDLYFRSCIAD